MSANLDTLLLHLEQVSATRTPVPPVNGAFTDPRQIANVMRYVLEEDWQYVGSHHIGGQDSDIHLLGYGDELRPLYRGADGKWYLAHKDQRHYGECDADGTKRLLKFAHEYAL